MTEVAQVEQSPTAPDFARYMRVALEAARRGMLAGEPPVGACLVRGGEIVATQGNAVIGELDITAHAEIRVIREACRELRRLELSGCTLFVTIEPCQMCLAACFYAGIDRIIYGASIADMHAVTGRELAGSVIASEQSPSAPQLSGGCLAAECRALLDAWAGGFIQGRAD